MSQYTLLRAGPRQYVLNPETRQVQVTLVRRVLNVALEKSVVVVNQHTGAAPEPDTDFLFNYQLSKL